MNEPPVLPCALSVAGSDSGGGAGVQADLRTFAALRVFGTSAITAVTAQNTRGVTSFAAIAPELVRAQIESVLADLPVRAVKTGMLANAEVVHAVTAALADVELPLVVDPVLVATSGDKLLDEAGERALRETLVPRATVVTPNLPEAAALTGLPVTSVEQQHAAARALVAAGARAALVKGGHAAGDPVDVFFDGTELVELRAPRIETTSTHGTGCTLSAAIAAELARGASLLAAARAAHAYLHEAIKQAPGLGGGHGPVHHMHPWYPVGRGEERG
jgi:hydroxymethylpyrimidine/phosphomethylpyrimidine kinase